MGEVSYDVRIWDIETRYSTRRPSRKRAAASYRVRWVVAGVRFGQTFTTWALADSFRSKLISASRGGEAFDRKSGLPVSQRRSRQERSWHDFAMEYCDMKWPDLAAGSRRSIAEALVTVTCALLEQQTQPDGKVLRTALRRWAYNPKRRNASQPPPEISETLHWAEKNSRPVSVLADPSVLFNVLDALANKLDGGRVAGNTFNRKRAVLHNALDHAVVLGLLQSNPMDEAGIKKIAGTKRVRSTVDRRSVANPDQARRLLAAVAKIEPNGGRFVAFFGAMYYAALRPEEAVNLREQNLALPPSGWGDILLEEATPDAGSDWTDTGDIRDRRPLKHRAADDPRKVPCPPELTALFHAHLTQFGTGADGRLFRGVRSGKPLDSSTYERIWRKARELALTPEQVTSPLAKRPYDLRHAAVSTWLNGGVHAPQVAEWAGHSVDVLLRVYAKCLDGTEDEARRRIEAALQPTSRRDHIDPVDTTSAQP